MIRNLTADPPPAPRDGIYAVQNTCFLCRGGVITDYFHRSLAHVIYKQQWQGLLTSWLHTTAVFNVHLCSGTLCLVVRFLFFLLATNCGNP